jgi:hypothetical protein
MKIHSKLATFASCAAALAVLGCTSKGPTPGESLTEKQDVVMAERVSSPSGVESLGIPTEDFKQDYAKTPHDPHGPAGHLNPPKSHVSGAVDRIDAGGLTFVAPEGWVYQHPTSSMRRAELGVSGEEGAAGLVVYFFGDTGAGSAQANIERWVGQFKNPDGTSISGVTPKKSTVAGFSTTQVEVAGTYVGGMGSGKDAAGKKGQRMIAAIVETARGPFYFKFLGDDAVVANNRDALDGMLASMKPSAP